MVQVIDEGPDPGVVKTTVCRGCGAKLAYVPNDVKAYRGRDISGGPDGREWVVCPACGKDVTLRSW
mgnify:CR=1 FL=1